MTDVNRVPLTIRLMPDDKATFVAAAKRARLEPSVAARQVVELLIDRLKSDPDFIDALSEVKNALKKETSAHLPRPMVR